MKRDENVEEVLRNDLPSASSNEAESAGVRVLERLQTNLGIAASPALLNFDPRRRANWRPIYALAAAAAIVLAVLLPIAMRPSAPAVLEVAARKVHFGEAVKSEMFGEVVELEDGSRIEMRTNSELVLERAEDGVRIRLDKGDIVVSAARQHGHLYVQTKDVMVSVVGTVFYVKAEKEGSRVAVFEGEVHVKQGQTEKKLGPGDQVASNPKMEAIPVREQVAWSREAATHLAMLPQTPSPPSPPRVAFEVVSIRPSGPAVRIPGARGGGQGLNSRPHPNGCVFDSFGYSVQLDPRRLAVTRTTVMHLVAYIIPDRAPGVPESRPDLHCGAVTDWGLLTGGPDWIRNDVWDVEAAIPQGAFTRKPELTDPVLQQMIRTMLEERFKLVLRHETRDVPVYLLKVRKDGPKFNGSLPLTSDHWAVLQIVRRDADGKVVPVADLPPPADGGIVAAEGQLTARNVSMTNLANHLYGLEGRPVFDRTGLTGRYDFHYIEPGAREKLDRFISGSSILEGYGCCGQGASPGSTVYFGNVLNAIGLELVEGTAPFDAWVIERAEKPSEN